MRWHIVAATAIPTYTAIGYLSYIVDVMISTAFIAAFYIVERRKGFGGALSYYTIDTTMVVDITFGTLFYLQY